MFDRIGSKIKTVAVVVTILGMIASVIGSIAIMVEDDFLKGLIVAVIGVAAAWLGSLTLYGFGELVENSGIIVEYLRLQKKDSEIKKEFVNAAVTKTVTNDEWKCSACGRVNKKYVTTCACGRRQFERVVQTVVAENTVTCPECGDVHPKGTVFCVGCGTKLN